MTQSIFSMTLFDPWTCATCGAQVKAHEPHGRGQGCENPSAGDPTVIYPVVGSTTTASSEGETMTEQRFCNKCGYMGNLQAHPGCNYFSAPIVATLPPGMTAEWLDRVASYLPRGGEYAQLANETRAMAAWLRDHPQTHITASDHIDTLRLDWLDRLDNGTLQSMLYLGGPWRWFSDAAPAVGYWKFEDHQKLGKFESVRAAIDTAIAQEKESK